MFQITFMEETLPEEAEDIHVDVDLVYELDMLCKGGID